MVRSESMVKGNIKYPIAEWRREETEEKVGWRSEKVILSSNLEASLQMADGSG